MHHYLDAYAYTNHLKQLPPLQKLLFALTTLAIALLAHPLTQAAIFVWLNLWTIGYARIPIKVYGRVLGVVSIFLLTSLPALLINAIALDEITAIQANSLGGLVIGNWYLFVSYSGLMQAMEIVMRSLACFSCLLFILFTIPFAELLSILRQCRFPPVLLDLLLLMYRFVFLFLDVATQLQLAMAARGGYRTRQRWMQSVALLAGQLVVRSLQRYQQFSLGLTARGFNGQFQVYSTQSYNYSQRYALESLLGCIGLVIFELKFW
ncbi:Cobalt ABC transporter, permease protein CbiQ [Planktothrix serta PCC 8927]|uniref:Cobalt ABC transporter, permease protein CbiQ n=1 Tax=Planktothrix serta PCC 8927 TaxID=671068 RepID=A0A7Z9E0F6_9CYAN|nr:cobalt ECF transporter T component CbiQ [Planktothrix serta]VXD21697.1 Cobalt ABC transporter, permease protein CbiQ [Planktothrix serta PCC 8927]